MTYNQEQPNSGTNNQTQNNGGNNNMTQAQVPQQLNTGDTVQITCNGRTKTGTVKTAERFYNYTLPKIDGRPQVDCWYIQLDDGTYWKQDIDGGTVTLTTDGTGDEMEQAQEQVQDWYECPVCNARENITRDGIWFDFFDLNQTEPTEAYTCARCGFDGPEDAYDPAMNRLGGVPTYEVILQERVHLGWETTRKIFLTRQAQEHEINYTKTWIGDSDRLTEKYNAITTDLPGQSVLVQGDVIGYQFSKTTNGKRTMTRKVYGIRYNQYTHTLTGKVDVMGRHGVVVQAQVYKWFNNTTDLNWETVYYNPNL